MFKIFLVVVSLIFVSCRRHSNPKGDDSDLETYVIVATNDIHGGVFPNQMIRGDTKQKYTAGGLVYLANMIDTIREEYGKDRVLYLDGGDQYQGGIEASDKISNGSIMNDFLNDQKSDASAIGNHEFDNGPAFFLNYLKNTASPYLAGNLKDEKGLPINQFLANGRKSELIAMGGGFKVGVVGLITQDTPFTTSGFTANLFPNYTFADYKDVVIEQAKALRKKGADIIVVLAHQGNICANQSLERRIWTPETHQRPCPEGKVTKLIDSLPKGTIQAFVQGHVHQITHFFKNKIPIVGTDNGGFNFNLIYLNVDKKSKRLVSTQIEGPIPICQKVFSRTKRCDFVPAQKLPEAGELTEWKFHGNPVRASSRLQTLFNKWLPKMEPYLVEIVESQVFLKMDKTRESQLGNLFADLFLQSAPDNVGADFSVINPGQFRTSWQPGVILEQHLYGMFPFKNVLYTCSMYGSELKAMFQTLQAGVKGFYSFAGLKMTVTASPKSLVNITLADGTQIVDDQQYTGVISDFLLGGGDDMEGVINKTYTPRLVNKIGDLKDTIRPRLKALNVITPTTSFDPINRRLTVV